MSSTLRSYRNYYRGRILGLQNRLGQKSTRLWLFTVSDCGQPDPYSQFIQPNIDVNTYQQFQTPRVESEQARV